MTVGENYSEKENKYGLIKPDASRARFCGLFAPAASSVWAKTHAVLCSRQNNNQLLQGVVLKEIIGCGERPREASGL